MSSALRPALMDLLEAMRVGHVYGRDQSKFCRTPAGDVKVTLPVEELMAHRLACKALVTEAGTYLVVPTPIGITASNEHRKLNGATT